MNGRRDAFDDRQGHIVRMDVEDALCETISMIDSHADKEPFDVSERPKKADQTEEQHLQPTVPETPDGGEAEIPDEPIPEGAIQRKTNKSPQILSIREYIQRHYAERMSKELRIQLESGKLNVGGKVVAAYEDTFRIERMSFWRESSRTCVAHVQLIGDAIIEEDDEEEHFFRGNYSAIITFDMTWDTIETDFSYSLYSADVDDWWAETCWKLDDYLVPILSNADIEEGSWRLHCRHFPTRSVNDEEARKEYDAYEMARRMGLEVMTLPLYAKDKTKGLLFFCADRVQTVVELPNGKKAVKWTDVPANCIVLNANGMKKDEYQLEVFHECIHYDWHYMFYRLQEMHINDLRKLERVVASQHYQQRTNKSLSYLEYQARRGSFGLMMPLPVMRPLVKGLIEEYKRYSRHAGDLLERVGRAIHRKRDHAKFRVRARLIQMGYIEAKGALNYVEGRYIEPFAFSRDRGDKSYTFVADGKSIIEEYGRNEEFRKRLDSGRYVHADGHLCINDPLYVRKTREGYRLTAWANAHVDECCLRFTNIYQQTEAAEYVFGRLASDEEYDRHYLEFAGTEAMSEEERMLKLGEIVDEMPQLFHKALKYLMDYMGMTIEDVEEKAHISSRTLSRLRTEEKREYSLDQVIGICIAMHLPPMLSGELIERAGFVLRKIPLHRAYKVLLDCKFMDTVDEAQEFLVRNGYQRLKLKTAE